MLIHRLENNKILVINNLIINIKTKKIINKLQYEPVYKFINESKLSSEEKIKMLSTYQSITSNIAVISMKKNTDYKKYLKVIHDMKNLDIKYGSITYDN